MAGFAGMAYLLSRIIRRRLAVETEQSTEIEFGCLEELDFSHVHLQIVNFNPSQGARWGNARSAEGICPAQPSRSHGQ
jgi:hypothetical protein